MIEFDFEYDFKLRSTINFDFRFDFIFYSENNFYSTFVSVIKIEIEISFFLKSVFRFNIHTVLFLSELKIWADFVEIVFDFLIQIEKHIFLTLKLLHHYKHLNDEDFRNFFCTDLIIHRIRLIFQTFFSSRFQLR